MILRWRFLFVVLLVLALPLQGYAAASAIPCDAHATAADRMELVEGAAQMAGMIASDHNADSGKAADPCGTSGVAAPCCHAAAVVAVPAFAMRTPAAQAFDGGLAVSFQSHKSAVPDKPPPA